METKKHISNKSLEAEKRDPEKFIFIPVTNLNRYIRGDRTPSLKVARTISQIVRCKKDIWLDRDCVTQRVEAINEYARKNKFVVQFHRGRPKLVTKGRKPDHVQRSLRSVKPHRNDSLLAED